MRVLEEMSNNQLQTELRELEEEHKAQKDRILAEVIKMEEIERRYNEGKRIIINRLKR
jgi:hypothetical protein